MRFGWNADSLADPLFQGVGEVWSGQERLGRVRYLLHQAVTYTPLHGSMRVIEGSGRLMQERTRPTLHLPDGRTRRFVILGVHGRGQERLEVEGNRDWCTSNS